MRSSKTTLNHSSLGNKPRHLIVGYMGEVGRALYDIFYQADYNAIAGIDRNPSEGIQDCSGIGDNTKFDILHICIPFGPRFEQIVREYQKEFKSKFTVIHSTVPVGTCSKLNAIHSPIRGIHPNLKEGIMTFPKLLGGKDASKVADAFRRVGMKVILYDKSETTEAAKLFDTEYYRACIEFAQRVKTYCDKQGLSFHEVYTLPNITYNEGYTELGHPEFVRPVLQPIMTPIGGHCVLPNKELIND